MASLAEREALRGKVQMIYIDPPYGIKFGSQLAGLGAQARRQGRQARGRHPRGRADQGVPRHVGARHPLVPHVPARPAGGRPGSADRESGRASSRSATRTSISSGPHGRGVRQRELRESRSRSRRRRRGQLERNERACRGLRLHRLVRDGHERSEVSAALFARRTLGRPGERHVHSATRGRDGARRRPRPLEKRGAHRCRSAASFAATTSRLSRASSKTRFPVEFDGRTFTPANSAIGRRTRQGWSASSYADRRVARSARRSAYVRYLDDFPAFAARQPVDRHGQVRLRRSEGLRRADEYEGHRALHA